MVLTSYSRAQERQFSFSFSNDIWNKTDRYYSNGFHASYTDPALLLNLSLRKNPTYNTAGINLFQDIYTPSVYNTNVYNPFDRPYAGVLAAEYFIAIQKNRVAIKPSLLVGVIGKAALGQEVQNGVHEIINNLEALGWAYQIENGFLLNAGFSYYYALLQQPKQQVSFVGNVNLGSYRNNVELGLQYQLGNRMTLLPLSLLSNDGKWAQSLLIQAKVRAVGYDATLQGAWNQSYTYGLPDSLINRLPIIASISYTARYENFQLALEQNFQSPEFDGAESHRWLGISLAYYFR